MKHRLGLALSLALLTAVLVPSTGSAATTIGQSPPTDGAAITCDAGSAHVQDGANGVPYIVPPGGGVITSWSHDAAATPGTMALATFREEAGATNYSPIAESDVETITPSTMNTFDTRIVVTGGELIGLHVVTGNVFCRHFTNLTGDFDFWDMAPVPAPGSGVNSYGQAQERYRLNVSAVIEPDADGDGFGDETQDGCPNSPIATDCVNPEVTIDKGPRKQSKKRTAKFLFSSNEAGATFECSLDGKAFTPCTSPLKTKKLKRKKHTFSVRAVDGGGNKSADAVYKWKVKKKKKK